MLTFISTYFPYLTLILMLLLAGFGGWFLIFSPGRQVKREVEEIQAYLGTLPEYSEVSERFIQFDIWVTEKSVRKGYIKDHFKPVWDSYYKQFLQLRKDGVIFTPDIYNFFVEDIFVSKFGQRKLVEIIPGIFLALGIIGTFMGIATGVAQLKMTGDPTVVQQGIDGLLGGMRIKFISSIVGIFFSVLWQIIDKTYYYPVLINSFMRIRQSLDEVFPTQEESTVLYQMFKNQEKQIEDFQGFVTEVMIPNMVSGFSEAVNQSLAPHLEQTQAFMSDMVKSASTSQLDGINNMVDRFVSSLSEITGEHMKGLGEALKTTIEWQQRVHTEMSELVQSMQESAQGQSLMVEKTTALTEQIHSYTDNLTNYQTVFENTIAQLNETTEKNSYLQTSISSLLEKMTEERKTFNDYFVDHLATLKSNMELVVTQTEQHKSLHDKLENNLQYMNKLSETQHGLSETLTKQADAAQQSHQDFTALLVQMNEHGDTYAGLQQGLNEVTEKNAQLQENIAGLLEQMVKERDVFHQHFNAHLTHLESNVGSIVSQTERQSEVQTQLSVNLQEIQYLVTTQRELAAALTEQAELSGTSNQALSELLEQIGQHGSLFGDLQDNLKEALNTTLEERHRLDEMMNDLYAGLTDQLEQMDSRSETLKHIWDTNKDAITTANKQLSQSINQFTDDMHRGLQHTFTQFDEELSRSVQYLAKGVEAIQEGVEDLPDALNTLKYSVTELNKHAKNMVKAGE